MIANRTVNPSNEGCRGSLQRADTRPAAMAVLEGEMFVIAPRNLRACSDTAPTSIAAKPPAYVGHPVCSAEARRNQSGVSIPGWWNDHLCMLAATTKPSCKPPGTVRHARSLCMLSRHRQIKIGG